MEKPVYELASLFRQLGLPDGEEEMDRFIAEHRLAPDQAIEAAPFWSSAQAAFLSEELAEDADWAEVVDGLNVLLHDQRGA
ncbi:DUF2789 domain-containing protein [endosymbiont of unidentified scaly snail isolate Monju]|uniref:DUF2789 domain-containing protein n=1 Tax=endosymbiont of unidentified scaly snail isolate Monju TaxID=1248727 RepID=UPI0005BA9515|nr:DUF2789 domain-containing protein [endosymbiont of unidentified scaly snail isolate Monju]